jgi:hypothetical protein
MSSATISKAAQYIVWDARKNDKSFAQVMQSAQAQAVTDTEAELYEAFIGTRPYKPRTYTAQVVKPNPFKAAWDRLQQAIEDGLLSEDEATGYANQIKGKEKEIADKAKAHRLQSLSETILAL